MSAFHRIDFGEIIRNQLPEKGREGPTYKIFNISVSPHIKTQLSPSPPKGFESAKTYQVKFTHLLNSESNKDKEQVLSVPLLLPPSHKWTEGALKAFNKITETSISLLDYPSPLHFYARSLIAAYVVYKVLRHQGAAIASAKGGEELLSLSPEGNLEINIDKMLEDLQAYKILDYVEFNMGGDSDAKMSS